MFSVVNEIIAVEQDLSSFEDRLGIKVENRILLLDKFDVLGKFEELERRISEIEKKAEVKKKFNDWNKRLHVAGEIFGINNDRYPDCFGCGTERRWTEMGGKL